MNSFLFLPYFLLGLLPERYESISDSGSRSGNLRISFQVPSYTDCDKQGKFSYSAVSGVTEVCALLIESAFINTGYLLQQQPEMNGKYFSEKDPHISDETVLGKIKMALFGLLAFQQWMSCLLLQLSSIRTLPITCQPGRPRIRLMLEGVGILLPEEPQRTSSCLSFSVPTVGRQCREV